MSGPSNASRNIELELCEFAIKNDTQKSTPLRLDIIVMEIWAILTPDENTAFSDVTPCSWVDISQRF
jgi:hypothetical protein